MSIKERLEGIRKENLENELQKKSEEVQALLIETIGKYRKNIFAIHNNSLSTKLSNELIAGIKSDYKVEHVTEYGTFKLKKTDIEFCNPYSCIELEDAYFVFNMRHKIDESYGYDVLRFLFIDKKGNILLTKDDEEYIDIYFGANQFHSQLSNYNELIYQMYIDDQRAQDKMSFVLIHFNSSFLEYRIQYHTKLINLIENELSKFTDANKFETEEFVFRYYSDNETLGNIRNQIEFNTIADVLEFVGEQY